ncbi:hypothetical protein [Streptomyces sp. NPDC088727]|uniref:hypothetical protein n=1 Tax=Streptomyces sp. NPDC088727 TaxID=3365875 RepID=UPI00381E3411
MRGSARVRVGWGLGSAVPGYGAALPDGPPGERHQQPGRRVEHGEQIGAPGRQPLHRVLLLVRVLRPRP